MKSVLFCGNDKVFDGVLSCMLSIFKRTQSTEPITFFIFTMDVSHIKPQYTAISDKQIDFLQEVAKSYNSEHVVKKVDVTEIYKKEFDNCPNEMCYCSPYTLIRLFADLIPEIPGKLLYLDVDLLFNRDIDLLWNTDVSKVEYAAARDHYGKHILFFMRKFINAGVILFNMDECRKNNFFEKTRGFIKTQKLLFADQSAIIKSTTKQMILNQRFNDQKFLYKNTVIRHFSQRLFYLPYPHVANVKQWMVSEVYSTFRYKNWDDVLYEYIYLKTKFEREINK